MPTDISPAWADNADDDGYEPLSVADRIELGRIQPWGNASYLAEKMGGKGKAQPWHEDMPPSQFPCPLCTGTVTARSNPQHIGGLTVVCSGSCSKPDLQARLHDRVPYAFRWRDDFIAHIPSSALKQLLIAARGGVGTFRDVGVDRAALSAVFKRIGALKAGATVVREHLVRAPDDSTLILILRFEGFDEQGKATKVPCPIRCVRNSHGSLHIEVGLPAGPWPIVGLADLAQRPDAAVVIVEGEKTREAAAALLPQAVACTSLCGAENAHCTDWSPLRGRQVVVVPDNDEPGRHYARSVAAQAHAAGATSVRIAELPGVELPPKWDLADDLPAGIPTEAIGQWIDEAPAVSWASVKDAFRTRSQLKQRPPFRLPDGHFARDRRVVDGIGEALEHISSGCARTKWLRVMGGIFHAVGLEAGLPLAQEWSRSGHDEHNKYAEDDWPAVFEAIAQSPPDSPMSLKNLLWEARTESEAKAAGKDRGNSEGWKPDAELMADATVAAFEAEHRQVLRGDGPELASQKLMPDGSYKIDVRSMKAAEVKYRAKRVVGHNGKAARILDLWRDNQRLPVLDAVFRPGAEVADDEYNLFRGLAVRPKQDAGSYSLFRELLNRVGADNGDSTDFIWKLIAWRLQNLNAVVPSALVFVGPEGSFKSTITDVIAKLLAPHSLTVSDPGKFVGRFNAQLFGKLFVQLEEVSLGRDDTLDSRMKHFINGETLDLEEKGQPAFSIENRLFIAITSNKRDVIRVSPNSRRYAAYWVRDPFNGDEEKRSAHWEAMNKELQAGGLEALMHDLLQTDLSVFNPRLCPQTDFFHELAGITADSTPHIAWWRDVLERGELPSVGNKGAVWTDPVFVDVLYRHYVAYCEDNGPAARSKMLSNSAWAREMNKILPGKLEMGRAPPSDGRRAFYRFPPYEDCCAAFERAQRVTIERAPDPEQEKVPF